MGQTGCCSNPQPSSFISILNTSPEPLPIDKSLPKPISYHDICLFSCGDRPHIPAESEAAQRLKPLPDAVQQQKRDSQEPQPPKLIVDQGADRLQKAQPNGIIQVDATFSGQNLPQPGSLKTNKRFSTSQAAFSKYSGSNASVKPRSVKDSDIPVALLDQTQDPKGSDKQV